MGIFIYGTAIAKIGVGEALVRCPSCEKDSWAQMMVQTVYFHIYWLPMFPVAKVAYLECEDCGMKRREVPFTTDFFRDFTELNTKFKHPFYLYPGAILVGLIVIAVVFGMLSQ